MRALSPSLSPLVPVKARRYVPIPPALGTRNGQETKKRKRHGTHFIDISMAGKCARAPRALRAPHKLNAKKQKMWPCATDRETHLVCRASGTGPVPDFGQHARHPSLRGRCWGEHKREKSGGALPGLTRKRATHKSPRIDRPSRQDTSHASGDPCTNYGPKLWAETPPLLQRRQDDGGPTQRATRRV